MAEYGIFLLKTLTIVVAIVIIIVAIAASASRGGDEGKGKILIKKLNEKYSKYKSKLEAELIDKKELKKQKKQQKKADKNKTEDKPRIFVLSFAGDMHASQVKNLREEIDAILQVAKAGEEVILKLESPGGVVHGYGLAASQLMRIRDAGLKLTVAVDKVAASGGYMMASVAHQIIAAPFAVIGSIGVVMQLPNFNKLLRKNDIEIEQITAGKYKRTLTMLGENTDEDREKVKQDIEEIHVLFKNWVAKNRRQVDVDEVANGDIWFGQEAIENKLVDKLMTSDQLLMDLSEKNELIEIQYKEKQGIAAKFGKATSNAIETSIAKLVQPKHWY